MNSPPSFFKAEQLTPSSSPISLSLDDPRNVSSSNGFASLLASPTRFKLSDSISTTSRSNGTSIFPTSLSKLGTYNRGRSNNSNNKSSRDNELRPVSPIRFNNNNNNNNNNKESTTSNGAKPVMFKQEFISNYSSLPLLSTLLKASNNNNGKNKQSTTNSKTLNPLLDDDLPKLSIKETLQRIQQYNNNNKLQSNAITPSTSTINTNNNNTTDNNNNIPAHIPIPTPVPTTTPIPQQHIQQPSYDIIESNNQIVENEMLLAPPLELQMKKPIPANTTTAAATTITNNNNDRIASNTSTLYSKDELFSEQNLITDKNGFVKYMNNNSGNAKKFNNNQSNNVNRYSFISSTSTDYDNFDLYEQPQPHVQQQQQQQQYIQQPRRSIHNHHLSDINEFTNRIESNKLDIKIKQLEIEIDELKLQNMKLINSINQQHQHQTTTTQYFNKESNFDELDENIHLKQKLKKLEKKIDSYKKTILSNSQTINRKQGSTVSTNKSCNSHNRISRISTQELQKFEETTDPSSSFSSIYSDDEGMLHTNSTDSKILTDNINNNSNINNNNLQNESSLLECDYEADIDDEHMIHLPKRRGFHLNIPIEK